MKGLFVPQNDNANEPIKYECTGWNYKLDELSGGSSCHPNLRLEDRKTFIQINRELVVNYTF